MVMYWIVLPTAFPTFRHRLSNELLELAIHICLIGLPTAFIVRRYSEVTDRIVMSDPLDFTGKIVLVTGSSRGIGAEMIKAFGQRGAQCVVNYRPGRAGPEQGRCDESGGRIGRPARNRL